VEHKLVIPTTVDHYYPNDALAQMVRAETTALPREHRPA